MSKNIDFDMLPFFRPTTLGDIIEPSVVTDRWGRIITVVMPQVLMPGRVVSDT